MEAKAVHKVDKTGDAKTSSQKGRKEGNMSAVAHTSHGTEEVVESELFATEWGHTGGEFRGSSGRSGGGAGGGDGWGLSVAS